MYFLAVMCLFFRIVFWRYINMRCEIYEKKKEVYCSPDFNKLKRDILYFISS